MANSKRRRQELRVVFDTSAIFTGSTSDLLRSEVASFMEGNTAHTDLDVRCYLPEIVVLERQFQMLTKAFDLLTSIGKLERLLGHNLGITQEIIESRVKQTVQEQTKRFRLKVQPLNTNLVDWKRLIEDSVYRKPPFEVGEKEKGFRDCLVMETFQQLVDESPMTSSVCRIVLLTGDKLLGGVATERMATRTNVRVMESLEDVKGLINTLVSEVDEEFVNKVRVKATNYFFEKDTATCLFYREKLQSRISEKFFAELAAMPPGANKRQIGTWHISSPHFIKKEGQRIYWVTRIIIETEAKKREDGFLRQSRLWSLAELSSPPTLASPPTFPGFSSLNNPQGTQPTMTTEQSVARGKTTIEVVWSVVVSISQRLSKPKIESISFIETVWDS